MKTVIVARPSTLPATPGKVQLRDRGLARLGILALDARRTVRSGVEWGHRGAGEDFVFSL